jgi:hypothetical protein
MERRTVQRVEAGISVTRATVAQIAGALGVKTDALLKTAEVDLPDADGGPIVVLHKVTSGRGLLSDLDRALLSRIECEVDPAPDTIETLKAAIRCLEGLMPGDPWDESEARSSTPRRSLVDELDSISALNQHVATLGALGLGIFAGGYAEFALMPRWSDEGLYVRDGQKPDLVWALRLLIAPAHPARRTVAIDERWPVSVYRNAETAHVPF